MANILINKHNKQGSYAYIHIYNINILLGIGNFLVLILHMLFSTKATFIVESNSHVFFDQPKILITYLKLIFKANFTHFHFENCLTASNFLQKLLAEV